MKCDVYFNLHKKCLSLRSREPGNYGRVVSHRNKVHLKNVDFVVNPAGREKVLAEKRKNVHAFVRGETTSGIYWSRLDRMVLVSYNPYIRPYFFEVGNGKQIKQAKRVYIEGKQIWAVK